MVNQLLKLQQKRPKKSVGIEQYARYSGMAFQMILIILCGALLGQYLDKTFQLEKPLFTVFLSLIAIGTALYVALKDFIGNHEN
jgi:ATP synthase protein I